MCMVSKYSKWRRASYPDLLTKPYVWSPSTLTTLSKGAVSLFLDQESPSFYHQCNTSDVKSSKLIGCCKTTAMLVLCSIRCQWLNDSFPFEIFLSHLHCFADYEVSWCAIPNSLEWFVVFNGTWNSVGPYKCSFSQQRPLSATAASELCLSCSKIKINESITLGQPECSICTPHTSLFRS